MGNWFWQQDKQFALFFDIFNQLLQLLEGCIDRAGLPASIFIFKM
jgi:hypothetical protein